jgi:hypothetical protein
MNRVKSILDIMAGIYFETLFVLALIVWMGALCFVVFLAYP